MTAASPWTEETPPSPGPRQSGGSGAPRRTTSARWGSLSLLFCYNTIYIIMLSRAWAPPLTTWWPCWTPSPAQRLQMRTLTTRGTMTTTMGASRDTDTATTTATTDNNYYNILKTRAIFANIKTVYLQGDGWFLQDEPEFPMSYTPLGRADGCLWWGLSRMLCSVKTETTNRVGYCEHWSSPAGVLSWMEMVDRSV